MSEDDNNDVFDDLSPLDYEDNERLEQMLENDASVDDRESTPSQPRHTIEDEMFDDHDIEEAKQIIQRETQPVREPTPSVMRSPIDRILTPHRLQKISPQSILTPTVQISPQNSSVTSGSYVSPSPYDETPSVQMSRSPIRSVTSGSYVSPSPYDETPSVQMSQSPPRSVTSGSYVSPSPYDETPSVQMSRSPARSVTSAPRSPTPRIRRNRKKTKRHLLESPSVHIPPPTPLSVPQPSPSPLRIRRGRKKTRRHLLESPGVGVIQQTIPQLPAALKPVSPSVPKNSRDEKNNTFSPDVQDIYEPLPQSVAPVESVVRTSPHPQTQEPGEPVRLLQPQQVQPVQLLPLGPEDEVDDSSIDSLYRSECNNYLPPCPNGCVEIKHQYEKSRAGKRVLVTESYCENPHANSIEYYEKNPQNPKYKLPRYSYRYSPSASSTSMSSTPSSRPLVISSLSSSHRSPSVLSSPQFIPARPPTPSPTVSSGSRRSRRSIPPPPSPITVSSGSRRSRPPHLRNLSACNQHTPPCPEGCVEVKPYYLRTKRGKVYIKGRCRKPKAKTARSSSSKAGKTNSRSRKRPKKKSSTNRAKSGKKKKQRRKARRSTSSRK